ncbi:C4-dicarboxylate ABC transporter [Devosia pacifica]|uniref:TRAP transporter small permease protein n=1 Tax=Devosia pacifica TaxID=1335967 RepID=A0A918SEB2_9HYPH|nr:TRAP transporter small permease subunit [Devosia pacifica]GHA34597.1 C4-dicarboxylate ABC transporter [Devosia pacifica]
MQILAGLVRLVGGINWIVGQVLSWLALACVVVCFAVVVQRYLFSISILWMQDLYVWLSGAMFTGVAGFALLRNDHVRVDVFYRPWPVRRKAIADLFGVVFFLLPFVYVVWSYGFVSVSRSWGYYEGSANFGGMPGLFVLKTFVLVFAVLIGIQGISMAARSILVLAGEEHRLPEGLRYRQGGESVPAGERG